MDPLEHWEKTSEREVPERMIRATTYVHRGTGARVLKLHAPHDDNRVFAVGFRTPPADDTGVAHIAEHSVLCGSRRYTTKEPFVDLLKGSLQTFLNAYTYDDRTLFPVASRCPRDFANLVDVYLDAVYHPRVLGAPEVFMQEGWRHELPAGVTGVVYNEMKGIYSQPDSVLSRWARATLYPGTPYAYDSGGSPECIPALTHEAFQAFHARCYHPSNSWTVFYGDGDTREELAALHERFLTEYARDDAAVASTEVPEPARASGRAWAEHEYAVASEDDARGRTHVETSWSLCRADDAVGVMCARGLAHLLVNKEGAPVREALIKGGLCTDVSAYVYADCVRPYLSVTAKNTEPDKAHAIVDAIEKAVRDVATAGFDAREVEGYLSRVEFSLREDEHRSSPVGLARIKEAMRSWIYGFDPLAHVAWQRTLDAVRAGVAAGRFFESAAERLLLENPHSSVVVLRPVVGLAERQDAEASKRVAAELEAMGTEGVEALRKRLEAFAQWQAREDTPEDLATIPRLSLADVRKTAEAFVPKETHTSDGITVRTFAARTNGIAYVRAVFDATGVPPQDAALVTALLQRLSTRAHSYAEMATRIDLYTGGTHESHETWSRRYSSEFTPVCQVIGKALVRRVPDLLGIMAEFAAETSYADHGRLRELLQEERSRMEEQLLSNGLAFSQLRASSCVSAMAAYHELTSGLSSYRAICELLKEPFDGARLQARLEAAARAMYDRSRLWFFVTAEEEELPGIVEQLGPLFAARMPSSPEGASRTPVELHAPVDADEALLMTTMVNFVSLTWRAPQPWGYSGAMDVLLKVLELEYLWPTLRVRGGAYGAFSNVSRDGIVTLSSYRDPRLKDSVEDLKPSTLLKLLGKTDSEESLVPAGQDFESYVIAVVGDRNQPLTPSQRGERALRRFLWELSTEDLQRELDEILSATPESVAAAARALFGSDGSVCLCAAVGDAALAAAPGLFSVTTKVMN